MKPITYGQGTVEDARPPWAGIRFQVNERRYPCYLRYPRIRTPKNLLGRVEPYGVLLFVPFGVLTAQACEDIKLGSRPNRPLKKSPAGRPEAATM